jgi:Na+:H+ antiporter, NhaA family
MTQDPRPRRGPVAEFLSTETASALALLAATVAALIWANAGSSYVSFWSHDITLGPSDLTKTLSRTEWVNEGLMAIFFFVVGLEIKRELVTGDLRDPRRAALPVVAAIGGMVIPAGVYLAVSGSSDGWGIPMATDIAFALGVFALAARGAPPRLRLFLLTLAVVDDLGAILVIAFLSAHGIDGIALLAAAGCVVATLALQRFGVSPIWAYIVPGVLFWACILASGLHATLAGVILGLLTPARGFGRPIARLEHYLHPVSSWFVVPLFALANAGVALNAGALEYAARSRIAWGVLLGLVVGKTVGITAATALARRTGLGKLPSGTGSRDVIGVAALGGIGFTVALFTAGLVFEGPELAAAKVAILAASVVAAVLGSVVLSIRPRRAGRPTLAAVPEKGA